MESAKQECQMKQVDSEQSDLLPAVVTCGAGLVGLLMIAASPWLVLTAGTATEQPAFQAAGAFSSVAEVSRIFSAAARGSTPEAEVRLAAASSQGSR
jgi:hypothetical protein